MGTTCHHMPHTFSWVDYSHQSLPLNLGWGGVDTLEPVHRSPIRLLPLPAPGLISAHWDPPQWQRKDTNLGKIRMQVPSGQKQLPCLLTPLMSSLHFWHDNSLLIYQRFIEFKKMFPILWLVFPLSSCFLLEGSSKQASPLLLGRRSPALVFRRFTQTSVEARREMSYCNNQDEAWWWLGIRWQQYRNPRQKGWIL